MSAFASNKASMANKKRNDSLPNPTIVQEPSVRLLPALDGIDRRPAAHLGRAGEDSAHDEKHPKFETGPFANDFRLDPARVGVVDDDLALLRGGGGDLIGDFLDGVDFEEFGEVVSGRFFLGISVFCCGIGDGLRGS